MKMFFKTKLQKALSFISTKLLMIEQWLNTKIIDEKLFNDLSPTDEPDNATTYYDAIQWALENRNINNIAICGSYGSGKSSIINGFFKRNLSYKKLKVSLASFNITRNNNEQKSEPTILGKDGTKPTKGNTKKTATNKCPNNVQDLLLEQSILQQIIYSVKGDNLPYSRFKRISNISKTSTSLWTFALVIWAISLCVFLQFEFLKNIPHWENMSDCTMNYISYISLGLLIFLSTIALFRLKKLFTNTPLNKLKIQSYEIELGKDVSSSILNKYLDEVLYFFEKTKYEILIFEDLDRFNNTDIFTKLRELNMLINNAEQIKQPVRFMYAIKDDIFKDEERTKFFDFVLPIIPCVNISNSGSKLLDMLNVAEEENGNTVKKSNQLDANFIEDISLFIHDMRTLKNISNEYKIYQHTINSDNNRDRNKLLATIVYKNKYPSDFSLLHNGEGIVHNALFSQKEKLVENKITEIEEEIAQLNKRLELAEEHTIDDIKELRKIYLAEFLIKFPATQTFYINNTTINFETLLEEDNFNAFALLSNINYWASQNYGRPIPSKISFKEIENAVNPNLTYSEREKRILDKQTANEEEIREEIKQKENELDEIKHRLLKTLCDKGHINSNDLKLDKLPTYLLRNGYIAEDYSDYISFFIEGSLTKQDSDFLISTRSVHINNFEYKLIKVENIVKKLRTEDISNTTILNIDLVNYLLSNKKYLKIRNKLFTYLAKENEDTLKFIFKYVESGQEPDKFIAEICRKNELFWDQIYHSNETSTVRNNILHKLTYTLDIKEIEIQNSNNHISYYIIENFNDALTVKDPYTEKFCETLIALNIKFSNLNTDTVSDKVFHCIYKNNLYEINIDMLSIVLNKFNDSPIDENDYIHKNYTTILKSSCKELKDYIDNNIDTYITSVFLKLEKNTKEDEKTIIELLNNNNIDTENRKEIIAISEVNLSIISLIKDTQIISYAFQVSKVQADWENVTHYFSRIADFEMDETLVNYLNIKDNYTELSKSRIKISPLEDETEEEKIISKFSMSLISCGILNDDAYEQLFKCSLLKYEALDFFDWQKKRVELLITNNYLPFSAERAEYIELHFKQLYIKYIEVFKTQLLEVEDYKHYINTEHTLARIITSDKFSNSEKDTIIEAICDSLDFSSKTDVETIIDYLANSEAVVCNSTIAQLLNIDGYSPNSIKLFNNNFDEMGNSIISECLKSLGKPYSQFLTSHSKNIVQNNADNLLLIKKLKAKKLISTYEEQGENIKVNSKVWKNDDGALPF